MSSALIPGEQLTACEFWKMDDFGHDAMRARDIELPTIDQLQALEQRIRAESHVEGYREGAEQARAELMRVHSLMSDLERELRRFDQGVADSLVALALEMARQLVKNSLTRHPEQVVEVVKEAMQTLPPFGEHAQLLLHPQDVELVHAHLGEQVVHAKWKLLEDSTIERGGCRVRTASMQVDATLAARWQRMAAGLARHEAWYDALAGESDAIRGESIRENGSC